MATRLQDELKPPAQSELLPEPEPPTPKPPQPPEPAPPPHSVQFIGTE